MQTEIETTVQSYLSRTFLIEFGGAITRDTDLFEEGVIDSYGFVELTVFLEETWGISFTDNDLASEGMATLAGIAALVAARRAPGVGPG